jgi:hypothetical protein
MNSPNHMTAGSSQWCSARCPAAFNDEGRPNQDAADDFANDPTVPSNAGVDPRASKQVSEQAFANKPRPSKISEQIGCNTRQEEQHNKPRNNASIATMTSCPHSIVEAVDLRKQQRHQLPKTP